MQTMYRDLRQELREVSTDSWALIKDDVITRQIEVERRQRCCAMLIRIVWGV